MNEWMNDHAQRITTLADYMYQEKREEEDLSTSETALTHPYNDSKTYIEKHKRGLITAIKQYWQHDR